MARDFPRSQHFSLSLSLSKVIGVQGAAHKSSPMLQKALLSIPDGVQEVFFRWEITPANGHVKLYRTPTDPAPQELIGPAGAGRTQVVERQTLYYELLPGSESFEIFADGWHFLNK